VTLDADVLIIAKHFGVDPHLIQAVVRAEGNILKAVQCSIPSVTTRAEALQITCRSAIHALCDWTKAGAQGGPEGFVQFWAARWAPQGAANDPQGLNAHWPTNVTRLWLEGT